MIDADLIAALTAFDGPTVTLDSCTSGYIPAPDMQSPAKEIRADRSPLRLVVWGREPRSLRDSRVADESNKRGW